MSFPHIRKSAHDSYADTPFMDEIALIKIPRKFSFTNIRMYDSTDSLENHVVFTSKRMLTIDFQNELRKITMCKDICSTLTGSALKWYINLPNGPIRSYATLTDQFMELFVSSRKLTKTANDLYEFLQHYAEPLRSYIYRNL